MAENTPTPSEVITAGKETAEEAGDFPAVPPDYLAGEFPSPVLADFKRIKRAPYRMVNPMKFAKKFGAFNREEILKNYQLAQSLAMQELDTELQGLSKYAPAAAALKRQEISVDNLFNQQQRSAQIASVMPDAASWLAAQADRANAYATGRMPSAVEDRALELGIRSQAADRAAAGGFGVASSAARKASDLMSAQQRIQLSQYGDQLLNQNIGTTAGLMLAPTEYSDAGTQIRVMPEVGGARLASAALSEANAQTMIPVTTGYQSRIQQRQYVTNLKQQTRMYNRSNQFAESQFNAQTQNQFALDLFGYKVGYAGVKAGIETANNNTALGLAQQAIYGQIFQDTMGQAQAAGEAGAIGQVGTAAINAIPGIINGISGMFSPNNSPTGDNQVGGSAVNSDGSANVLGDYSPDDIEFGVDGPTINGAPVANPDAPDTSADTFTYPTESQVPSLDVSDIDTSFPEYTPSYDYQNYSGTSGYSGSAGGLRSGAANVPGYQFSQATGLPYNGTLEQSSSSVQQMAGISESPNAIPNAVSLGANYSGKMVYTDPDLAVGQDTNAGNTVATTLASMLAPFNAYSPEEIEKINYIGKVSADTRVLNSLSESASRGDVSGFVDTGLKVFGKGGLDSLVKNPERNGIAASHAMWTAIQNFNQASPEQKSLLTAAFGLKAADFQGKQSLGEVVIPDSVKPATKPVTASKVLDWFGQGVNAYPLVKKWDQFSVISKFAAGTNDPDTVARTAKQFNLLGAGVNGAEVPGVTEASLTKAGWAPVPYMGVGAVKGRTGSAVPQGYIEVANDGKQTLAVPKGTAYTAQGAVFKPGARAQTGTQRASNLSPAASNILNWGIGAYNIYNMWQRKPGMGSVLGTANVVAQNVDKYNLQQAIENKDPELTTNLGQYAGAAMSAYNAYQQYQQGNKPGAAGGMTQAGLLGAQAYYTSIGDTANAQLMGQYAGYAGAGVNFYNAYKQWQAGDKEGAAASITAGGATLATGNAGAGLTVAGAYSTYKGWGSGSTKNGVIGGSMMLAGMAMMGMPLIGAGLMAVAVISNSIKTGKHKDQNARDSIRESWQANGFMVDKDYNVTLADGTLYNIGADGHSGEHGITNPDVINNWDEITGKGGKLHSYECDYTNDLDYTANMGGTTLTRLLFGEKAKNIDQIGGQLGNAALGNVGYNQQMTKENFDKVQANMRGFFAKAGIGSKTDAYQLANAAFAEGRLSESDVSVAHQAINMMYDEDGYEQAKQLMAGRNNGLKEAAEIARADKTDDNDRPSTAASQSNVTAVGEAIASKAEAPAFKPMTEPPIGSAPNREGIVPYSGEMPDYSMASYLKNRTTRMSKEEIQALNSSRYAEMV